ncbi:MAG: right-handed parallel beta-helix repeat-containing protein [Eubacterium sp.]|nr:right-handed parallel beta-helix repeat-containing protein [Eubacterium sp.]
MSGDWLVDPRESLVHTGDVYINGVSLFEAPDLESVRHPVRREYSPYETWEMRKEPVWNAEDSLMQWYCEAGVDITTIYAGFGDLDPNQELVEINVRPCCFYPEKRGLDYITVSGFEMAQAATDWAPPTAYQVGMLGPNWARGWIIENNILHDSKCSAISLGKEDTTGDNEFTKFHKKPGYQYQMESVFRAADIGWSKEQTGSHIVRGNTIYQCGQTGIVGHLGCIFSEIYENEIYYIGTKHEFYGHEIAGIKLHAAIDVQIHDNHIHHCSLGTWLDWQAQGTRVSSNLYHHNDRDFMIEVTHGPYLVDNNIFASPFSIVNAAQGGAYVHNLVMGFMSHYPVLNRSTPYHFPHSTKLLGTVPTYGSDDRWYQNIFVGGKEEGRCYGTCSYEGAAVSMEEYVQRYWEAGAADIETYESIRQPAYIDNNVYLQGAAGFTREEHAWKGRDRDIVRLKEEEDGIYLEAELGEEAFSLPTAYITTKVLGRPRITEAAYENPDGTPVVICRDMLGRERPTAPVPGPLQDLKPGKNRIRIHG